MHRLILTRLRWLKFVYKRFICRRKGHVWRMKRFSNTLYQGLYLECQRCLDARVGKYTDLADFLEGKRS